MKILDVTSKILDFGDALEILDEYDVPYTRQEWDEINNSGTNFGLMLVPVDMEDGNIEPAIVNLLSLIKG